MKKELPDSHWLEKRHLAYHQRQLAEPYRSTVHLQHFLTEILSGTDNLYRCLDVGCGAGANIFHLGKFLKNTILAQSWIMPQKKVENSISI